MKKMVGLGFSELIESVVFGASNRPYLICFWQKFLTVRYFLLFLSLGDTGRERERKRERDFEVCFSFFHGGFRLNLPRNLGKRYFIMREKESTVVLSCLVGIEFQGFY